MLDFINSWNRKWQHGGTASDNGMPEMEKEPEERVPYAFPVKKVQVTADIEIAYVDVGSENNSVLLFIHGMGSGIPVWEYNISELKKHFRCIGIDLPGHGHSSRGDFPYTMNFYTDVVLSFIDKLRLSHITLVGHSMGGQISIIAGIKAPHLIQNLVLVSPAGIEPYTAMDKQFLINTMSGVVASGNAFTKNRLNYMIGFCNNQEKAGELARKMAFYKNEAVQFGKMLQRSVQGMLLEAMNHALDRIPQPCLVIVGKKDMVSPYPFLRGQAYADVVTFETSKMKNCKLKVFPECGHFVQYQEPAAFNTEVMAFMKENELQKKPIK
jgi:pimeloyl-ACP methyl ester carboxylesterase